MAKRKGRNDKEMVRPYIRTYMRRQRNPCRLHKDKLTERKRRNDKEVSSIHSYIGTSVHI